MDMLHLPQCIILFVVYCFVAEKENEKGEYAGAVSVGMSSHYVYIVVPVLFIVLIA